MERFGNERTSDTQEETSSGNMDQQLQYGTQIAAQGARTSDTLPQPPNGVSQAEADILNSSEVREELSEFARKNDSEGFNNM
jgi:hypothetical protein